MLNSLETAGVQISNLDPESPQMYRRVAAALQNLINACNNLANTQHSGPARQI